MSKIVTGIGGFIILMALWFAIAPDHVKTLMDWDSQTGQNIAGGMRLVFGVLLMLAAPATRYPDGLRIFGGVIFLAGLGVIFLPAEMWSSVMQWWMGMDTALWRIGAGIGGLAMGAFFIHAARTREPSAS
jgi:hypothetical protein